MHKQYEQARKAVAAGLPDGPLKGVPYLIKDLGSFETGEPATFGSSLFKDFVADHETAYVTRCKKAGLVFIGRSSSPEFGVNPNTEPRLYGSCHNPWNLEYSPGDSYGGAAAAVSAGILPWRMQRGGYRYVRPTSEAPPDDSHRVTSRLYASLSFERSLATDRSPPPSRPSARFPCVAHSCADPRAPLPRSHHPSAAQAPDRADSEGIGIAGLHPAVQSSMRAESRTLRLTTCPADSPPHPLPFWSKHPSFGGGPASVVDRITDDRPRAWAALLFPALLGRGLGLDRWQGARFSQPAAPAANNPHSTQHRPAHRPLRCNLMQLRLLPGWRHGKRHARSHTGARAVRTNKNHENNQNR